MTLLLLFACQPSIGKSGETATSDPASSDYDVIVIGSGPAGLAATFEAVSGGARVLTLERSDHYGGNDQGGGSLMMFSGTPEEEAAGVVDSPEQLLSEWPSFTGGDPDDPWVQYFAYNNVVRVHDWLADLGLDWLAPVADSSGGTTARLHELDRDGMSISDAIAAQIPSETLRYNAQADDLLIAEDGRVLGVAWTDLATGASQESLAQTVVVATGGFMRNLDRVRQEVPEIAQNDLRWGYSEGADGNGLTMLEAHGAATQNLHAVGLYAHGVPAPGEEPGEAVFPEMSKLLWFDNAGERFCDESETNSFIVGWTRALLPSGDAWLLMDDVLASNASFLGYDQNTYTLSDLSAAGYVTTADTVSGLGDALGVPSATLEAEWEAFQQFSSGAVDSDPFRDAEHRGAAIQMAPFYAVPIAVTVAKGFGGIDVDLEGRVLDVNGAVIPGLYAAGELTGMLGGSLVGNYGFTGSLTAVVLGGRVAGENAVLEAVTDSPGVQ